MQPSDSFSQENLGQTQANVVTPPPATSNVVNDDEKTPAFPELDFLCDFLGVFKDNDVTALSDFLAFVGSETLDDLAFIQAGDFKDSSLSLTIQRKLRLIAEFLLKGGSLKDVGSMKELVKSIRSDRTSKTSPTENEISAASENTDESIITLDVGGHCFTTTRDTLCRIPSVLEGMFSGRHQNPALQKDDGSYVIDRDGSTFQHILNFLRVGAVISLPSDVASKEVLAVEADYYGLEELVRAIRTPQVDTSDFLSDEVLLMRKDEDTLRTAFMTGSAEGFDPHRGLIPLFCPDNGVKPLPLKYEPVEDASNVMMGNLRKEAPTGTPVCVSSLEKFHSNFNREHPNVLHRLSDVLLEEKVIIAGGAVLRALTSSSEVRTADWWGSKSDIDLFLHCRDRAEANRIARRIFFALAVDHERWVIMRSRGVITMHNWTGGRWSREPDVKVQIVLRLYESPAEVLVGFDCDSCCCAYDGRSVWVTPRCLRALRTGVNVLNPLHAWPNKPSYELRLGKYAYRGFAVVAPGLDKKRVDYERIRQTDLGELKGMARLLKVSFEMEAAPGQSEYFPQVPLRVPKLHAETKNCYGDAELLANGMTSGYDDLSGNVIVPSVYGSDGAADCLWWRAIGGQDLDFPLASDCRTDAWDDILNAGGMAPEGLPHLLLNSWDDERRSREYLNSEMNKFDLDNIYYGHAYQAADA